MKEFVMRWLFCQRPLLTDSFLFSIAAVSCLLYILCTWKFSSCCKLSFMFKEHGYSLFMRIQQLLQVVFYVQGACIFSVHENSAAAASCLLCSMSMDILCTWKFSSCSKLSFMYKEYGYSLYTRHSFAYCSNSKLHLTSNPSFWSGYTSEQWTKVLFLYSRVLTGVLG